jgi:hypothetical protein
MTEAGVEGEKMAANGRRVAGIDTKHDTRRGHDPTATTMSTREAAGIWGVSPDHLWELVRTGQPTPVPPLRLGRALRWPVAPVLASVGLHEAIRDDADTDANLTDGITGPT